jgi:hypothetical protein
MDSKKTRKLSRSWLDEEVKHCNFIKSEMLYNTNFFMFKDIHAGNYQTRRKLQEKE